MKHFKPCAYLHIKKLNHTFATRRGGIKKSLESAFLSPLPFFFFSSPISQPSPKICLNPSLRQHQSFWLSLRNIHSPFFSLFLPRCLSFWIIIHGSHSPCMASRQMTHLSRVPWGTAAHNSACFTEGHTETSQLQTESCFEDHFYI